MSALPDKPGYWWYDGQIVSVQPNLALMYIVGCDDPVLVSKTDPEKWDYFVARNDSTTPPPDPERLLEKVAELGIEEGEARELADWNMHEREDVPPSEIIAQARAEMESEES